MVRLLQIILVALLIKPAKVLYTLRLPSGYIWLVGKAMVYSMEAQAEKFAKQQVKRDLQKLNVRENSK